MEALKIQVDDQNLKKKVTLLHPEISMNPGRCTVIFLQDFKLHLAVISTVMLRSFGADHEREPR